MVSEAAPSTFDFVSQNDPGEGKKERHFGRSGGREVRWRWERKGSKGEEWDLSFFPPSSFLSAPPPSLPSPPSLPPFELFFFGDGGEAVQITKTPLLRNHVLHDEMDTVPNSNSVASGALPDTDGGCVVKMGQTVAVGSCITR